MVFIETTAFTHLLKAALLDRDYALLQQLLSDYPDAGKLIEGGGGIRKIRWAPSGRGKRGGFRIIYYWRRAHDQIYLLYLFEKGIRADLTPSQRVQLAALAKSLK
jgi:mRNA-degrading endonuclease RelE of RelBE toxin-antitoxin system